MNPQQNNRLNALYPKGQNPTGPYLGLLFVAEFADGHTIAQTPEDKSELDDSRSSFYDVLQYEKTSPITRFHLTNGQHWYTVDLQDGCFEIDGLPFHAHSQFQEIKLPLKLIYFREEHMHYGAVPERGPHYVNRYFIGWWFMDGKKKIEQTIAVPT